MPSQLRSDTARANGAKSRGPKSAETKEKSSRNSLRQGFTSRHSILLECENEDEFQELEEEFAATYQPATPAEQNLVDEMVAASWRIQRIRIIETVIMDCEMVRKKPEIEKEYIEPDSGIHMGMAFRTLAEESRSLSLCNRYESRFSRIFDRAYRTLRELQQQAAEPKKQKSEPKPPEPPKPNGGIQIAATSERAQPSEPEPKNKETNPSPTPTTVARALLRAVSRFFATPLSVYRLEIPELRPIPIPSRDNPIPSRDGNGAVLLTSDIRNPTSETPNPPRMKVAPPCPLLHSGPTSRFPARGLPPTSARRSTRWGRASPSAAS